MQLDRSTAVITGAANGIGRAIALAPAARNANIAVADIESDAADAVANEIESAV